MKNYEKLLRAIVAEWDEPRSLEGCRIFVNLLLFSCYCLLWSASKQLHGKVKIFGWHVSNGSIKIKLQKNSRPIYISHMEDFKNYFPDVDFHNL